MIRLPLMYCALLAAAAIACGCATEPEIKLQDEHTPTLRADGWEIARPEDVGFDRIGVDRAYAMFFDEDRFRTALSLLVARDGKLVGEGYCRDRSDADRPQNVGSCTKSVTALLTGMALQRGVLPTFDIRLSQVLAGTFDSPEKREITLEQALTMKTGLAYDNALDNVRLLSDPPENSLVWMQKGGLQWAPGTRFHYSDAPPHLVGAMLQRLAGHTLAECAQANLFGPLGINDFHWAQQRDGFSNGATGLYLKPRDLARLGQLYLQEGRWGDQQIVPADWIERSTSQQVHTGSGPYGYFWWIRPAFGACTMISECGTFCYVIPAKRIVIVMTAWPYVADRSGISIDEFEDIVQVLVDAAR